ncbi:Aste57867_24692 [Aphanomyces stellatus]|uniref:Aste57867_24692 protein n=1 Tax=Aphanomyces stellatus TaxID=120398 RepID=A0A485LRR6_9STRA|nr:hypothetical protein As57867_024614 [Aphanomyces stellatus]VFU01329.1 Aste57867_24692 [Aphanomyces stellatus]
MVDVVVDAATVVCLRESEARWDVLLGQNEVKNWLRSTRERDVLMRYPGEWKFPGGTRDAADASLSATATRELDEEFLGAVSPSSSVVLHFASAKTTIAVQGKRFKMHNFVALAPENPWLEDATLVDRINARLQAKRRAFQAAVDDGTFWTMDEQAKEALSPEVHQVQWFPIADAIAMMEPGRVAHVNAFQAEQFARYGVVERDPMYQSMRTLQDMASLRRYDIQDLPRTKI